MADNVAIATYVSIAAGITGSLLLLAYHIGRLSVRVDMLERARDDFERKFDAVHATLREIERLVRAHGV